MKFLLDTNAVIALLKNNTAFHQQLRAHQPSDFVLSSIVMYELYYGVEKSQRKQQNRAKLETLPFEVLAFSNDDAQIAGQIRASLEQKGTPIGSYDTLIAAQAISNQLILITYNTKAFQRIEQLSYEDWQ
ncbi:type II toxin-antitoxin system VapC family toxin [Testudinibacter sp. TR-2022]|uniref:type II toxin-antitoxin system VapC family toxin n=1 Tax=Testudinibacter sp. TR-2022 TaxID=2585029 RepID=UPI0011195BC2|nr:type II toxin-antitoxin system VapC family toxin [Testudinibacter sp. TR-2022]TNH04477.1 type II toxin-antitoxin system VapC family toxin [Pasteurellaceae bacterium Phil31]TNH12001.1 type II toxin-antitoxin system VapC family toxin [Testudinibacter sp. TR-2022]TNH12694.1 type II toxin-antitoxin system VapC family toxin [Testudinibacter sp. TR-2022]TNH12789.1 type II toxin-antitoxin system VapC family toxin [Testudinibacter sp. TR-2022]TNH19428.1 type II toxin-antitoxin system VapC family to